MAFTPNPPFPKSQGDVVRSSDWNDLVNEAIQLDSGKVSRSGDAITGSLTISGALGVGMTTAPGTPLEVHGHLTLEASASPNLFTGTGGAELNRYLQLLNSPGATSASGLKVGGVLVSDSYAFANPGKNDLVIKGRTAIGTPTPQAPLHILGGNWDVTNTEGDLKIGNDTLRLKIGVALAGGGAGDARIRAQGGTNRLMLGGGNTDMLVLDGNGVNIGPNSVNFSNLLLPKTASGSATFTNRTTFSNEGTFQPNNLKLSMGDQPLIIFGTPFTYEFCIGHTFTPLIIIGGGTPGTSFIKRLSVTQDGVIVSGNLTVTGSKSGYVVDNFINSVGDTLELGDVVVIGPRPGEHAYGVNNNIPIPEVDLTTNAYDTRVCGIVEKVVTASETPHVEVQVPVPPEALEGQDAPTGRRERQAEPLTMTVQDHERLQPLTAAVGTSDATKVAHGQMGKMVTLGAFAHCNVDADIAPIAVGDLLTTSPTKGHAQKVLEPGKAVGAIIGKALGALDRGKGKIPVLVMLH